ncbi:MAG: ribosome assembly cofactor RimP [Bacteroidetes bacterium]|nr:ribosome assembly cofactor RimP [Bacteroidota bacterium]
MISKESIQPMVEELLAGTDKFLVDIVVQPANKIYIYFDCDTSITISDCQEISRTIEGNLNRDYEDYDLTVSSSGIDRPLKLVRQYRKNIGKELDVVTHGGKNISGVLVKVDDESLELEHPVKKPKKEIKRDNTVLPFSEIKTAKIIVKFGK